MLVRVFSSLALLVIATEAQPQCNGACPEGDEVQFLHVMERAKLDSKDHKNSANGVTFKVSQVNREKNSLLSKGVKTSLLLGGGGNWGAAKDVGYLRALNKMGLLDRIDQMVEGVALVAAPMLYTKGLTFDQLLGSPTEPADLTLANLANASGEILGVMTLKITDSIGYAAASTFIPLPPASVPQKLSTVDFFTTVIALNYLCPYGLNGKLPPTAFSVLPAAFIESLGSGLPGVCRDNLKNKNQVWALDEAHLQRMASQNPTLDMEGNLTIQRTNVRSYIITGSLGPPQNQYPFNLAAPNFWLSPDQCGVPFYPLDPIFKSFDYQPINSSVAAREDVVLGGGVVDSIGCLSTIAPAQGQEQQGKTEEANSNFAESNSENAALFTLQDAAAIAANDYYNANIFNITGLLDTLDGLLQTALQGELDRSNPYPLTYEKLYWPVSGPGRGDVKERSHYIFQATGRDGNGMVHALQSGAKCFIGWTGAGLQYSGDVRLRTVGVPRVSDFLDCESLKITNFTAWQTWLRRPFISVELWGLTEDQSDISFAVPDETVLPGFNARASRHIFEPDGLLPLLCQAQENFDNKRPVRASATLTTVRNIFYGIEAGQKLRVLFIWQDQQPEFEALLPPETRTKIQQGDFTNGVTGRLGWPFLQPSFPNGNESDPVALTPEQANLLAAQAEWELLQMREDIEECMDGKKKIKNSYYARSKFPSPKFPSRWGFRRHHER